MAAKTSVMSLLLISLLSLYATTTVATFISPLTIPSCSSQLNPAKCYIDYKAAYAAAASAEFGGAANAVGIALNAVNAAKAGCSAALQFFHSVSGGAKGGSQMAITCQNTFSIAIHYLGQASVVMEGKNGLSKSEVIQVQKSVQVAAQNVMKCTASYKTPEAKAQTSQPANLCNIALNFCKMLGH